MCIYIYIYICIYIYIYICMYRYYINKIKTLYIYASISSNMMFYIRYVHRPYLKV